MTFQQLQYVLEVAHTGSVSTAAKKLFLSPSSVSVAVSSLEEELGYPIFVRRQKGLFPTVQGEKVLEYAKRILDTYRQLNSIEPIREQEVRIAGSNQGVINRAFARLVEAYPNAHCAMISSLPDANIQRLLSNELDLALKFSFDNRTRYMETKLERSGLVWKTIAIIPAAARFGPPHPLYEADSVTPRQLEKEMLVDSERRTIFGSAYLKGVMNFDPHRVITNDTPIGKRELICRGLAYDIVPLLPGVTRNPYKVRYVPVQDVRFQLIAYYNPRTPQKPEIKRFLEFLEEELQGE